MAERSMQQLPNGFLDVFSAANLPSTHPAAFAERGGKALRATTTQGFLCFGQYKQGYPTKPLQAVFSVLIDNNTADDRNILILDVYDHHSDRVLSKELITRKDFATVNDFCLFRFDFTPPSPQANMEFRIFYLGGNAYVRVDKIAVIDPAVVAVNTPADIPNIFNEMPRPPEPAKPQPKPVTPMLPEPWQIAKIGSGDGKILQYQMTISEIDPSKMRFKYGGIFTVEGKGSLSNSGDNVFFVYQKCKQSGNGKTVIKFSRRPSGLVGVMVRESLDPNSPFVMMAGHQIFYRQKFGAGISTISIAGEGDNVMGFKMMREGLGFLCMRSIDTPGEFGNNTTPPIQFNLIAYAGFAVGTTAAITFDFGMDYKDDTKFAK